MESRLIFAYNVLCAKPLKWTIDSYAKQNLWNVIQQEVRRTFEMESRLSTYFGIWYAKPLKWTIDFYEKQNLRNGIKQQVCRTFEMESWISRRKWFLSIYSNNPLTFQVTTSLKIGLEMNCNLGIKICPLDDFKNLRTAWR